MLPDLAGLVVRAQVELVNGHGERCFITVHAALNRAVTLAEAAAAGGGDPTWGAVSCLVSADMLCEYCCGSGAIELEDPRGTWFVTECHACDGRGVLEASCARCAHRGSTEGWTVSQDGYVCVTCAPRVARRPSSDGGER